MIAHPRVLSEKNPLPEKIKKFLPTNKNEDQKIPYHIGKHQLKGTTTFQDHYDEKNGKKSDMLKTPDNLKNKDFKLRDTTYKQHYKNLGEDPVAHGEVHYNKNQKHSNWKNDKYDRIMNEAEKHPDYLNRKNEAPNRGPLKDSKMVSNESKLPKNLKGYHNTTYKKHYDRNENPQPDINKEKYDNLTCNNLKSSKLPHQKEHFVQQRRQRELDKGLHNVNKEFDLDTSVPHNNPKVEKNTEYVNKYCDSQVIKKGHVVDSHNGQDVHLGTVLHQYMNSYYFKK